MHFKSSLTALAIMAVTLARAVVVPTDDSVVPTDDFVVPTGDSIMPTDNGVYTVNDKGEVIASGPLPTPQNITARDGFPVPIEVSCSGSLDPTNTANAVIALEGWCNAGGTVPGGRHAYALVNGIMAYVCSYGGDNPCSNVEYSWVQQAWEGECGTRWGTGYVWISAWAKTYGQGVYQPGGACANGAGSEFRVN